MNARRDAIVRRHAEELAQFDEQERKHHYDEWHRQARLSGFRVRASLMFNVPTGEVTQQQLNAAIERTAQDFVPVISPTR